MKCSCIGSVDFELGWSLIGNLCLAIDDGWISGVRIGHTNTKTHTHTLPDAYQCHFWAAILLQLIRSMTCELCLVTRLWVFLERLPSFCLHRHCQQQCYQRKRSLSSLSTSSYVFLSILRPPYTYSVITLTPNAGCHSFHPLAFHYLLRLIHPCSRVMASPALSSIHAEVGALHKTQSMISWRNIHYSSSSDRWRNH